MRSSRVAAASPKRLFDAQGPWLFGRSTDLIAFGGSALLSFAILGVGVATGVLDHDIPDWIFFACIVAVDVAHVWSTLFRVYFDGAEVRRRPLVYLGLPVVLYGLSVLLHAAGSLVFWRVLAYVAVFHFIRQQVGWMRLYNGRDTTASKHEKTLNITAIYLSTLYPVIWWHGHLPRSFHWFLEGDFVVGLSAQAATFLFPVYVATLVSFFVWHLRRMHQGAGQPGMVLLVLTTAATWYLGIVAFNSDLAFTVTNVIIHGAPYFVLTFRYARKRSAEDAPLLRRLVGRRLGVAAAVFALIVLSFALGEEFLWDRLVWHERPPWFGESSELSSFALVFIVPLLSLPQLTHYALDGLVWRRRDNPTLSSTQR
ncbi:MAG: hypothetical protein ACI9KE_002160 [Polyangiales bacterium]|jgi:hypothetical protein